MGWIVMHMHVCACTGIYAYVCITALALSHARTSTHICKEVYQLSALRREEVYRS
jgi:hypothetical protein